MLKKVIVCPPHTFIVSPSEKGFENCIDNPLSTFPRISLAAKAVATPAQDQIKGKFHKMPALPTILMSENVCAINMSGQKAKRRDRLRIHNHNPPMVHKVNEATSP